MSSNNNPQNAPVAPATDTAAPAPAVATQITLGAQAFELKGMSVQDGAKLYDVLGTLPGNYQRLADQYATIAKQFERVAAIQLPKDMTLKQAIDNYYNALKNGLPLTEPYLAQLDGVCRAMPGYAEVLTGIQRTRNAADLTGTAFGAAGDTAMSPVRFFSFLGTCLTEAGGAITPSMSDAQAKAIGAAYAGSVAFEGVSRQGMTTGQMLWNNPLQSALAGVDNLALNTPLIKDAWPYLYAAFKWVSGAITHFGDPTTKAPTFSEAFAEATQEIETSRARHPDWRSNVESRLQDSDFANANARLSAAGTIAGIAVQPIADAVAKENTIIDTNGHIARIDRNGAEASLETPTTGPDGKPLPSATRGSRIWESASNIFGDTGKNVLSGNLTSGGVAAVVVGSGGTLWVANKVIPGGLKHAPELVGHGVVKGAASVTRGAIAGISGLAAGMVEGVAELIPGGGARAVRKAGDAVTRIEHQMERHVNQADAARDALDALKASGPAHTAGVRGTVSTAAHNLSIRNQEARLTSAETAYGKVAAKLPAAQTHTTELLEQATSHIEAGGIRGWLTSSASWLSGKATEIEHLGDKGIHATVEISERLVANGAAEKLAVRATNIGGLALRVGRWIPFVGLAVTTGSMLLSGSAHAAEWNGKTGGDGKSRNFTDQLEYDHQRGAVDNNSYAALKAAQVAYAGSGLGGFATAGVAEGVQNAMEKLGKDRVQLYLPPSIISTVGEVSGLSSDQAQFTQAELNAAMAGVKAQAHKAARPMVNSRVTVGATMKTPSDDNIQIAGLKIPTFGLNHLFG